MKKCPVLFFVFLVMSQLSLAENLDKLTPDQISNAEHDVQRLKVKVAQNLGKIDKACDNITSTQCVNQKRNSAKLEGELMGAESALRELRSNNLKESDEYLQRRADSEQLRVWIENKCSSPENFKSCEESSIRLEETAAWLQSYFRHKWPNG